MIERSAWLGARILWRDKWLLAASLYLLGLTRLKLTLTGFGDPRRYCGQMDTLPASDAALAQRVAWCIDIAARFVPSATCLVRAHAGQRLLAMKGIGSSIHVGVRKGSTTEMEAHAWLISGNRIVLGGDEAELKTYHLMLGTNP
jgi:hypothetical protein